MEARDMVPGSADWRRLKALNRRAFPEDERRSIPVLALAARLREPVELKGWYEADCFTGFTVTVALGRCLYLAFIAVEEDVRSGGLGSAILQALRAAHPEAYLLVEIEDPREAADNSAQRSRRAAFYERNGFLPLERTITAGGIRCRLYATEDCYDRETYMHALRLLSLRPHSPWGNGRSH